MGLVGGGVFWWFRVFGGGELFSVGGWWFLAVG